MSLFNFLIEDKKIITNQNNSEIYNYCSNSDNIFENEVNIIYGYEKAKQILNKKIDVSTYKITDNIYWLAKKDESSKYFIDGLNYITDNIYDILTKNIHIEKIDISFENDYFTKLDNIIKDESIIYTNNKIDYYLYLDNVIYIFDLRYLYYFEMNKEISLLYNKLNKGVYDKSNEKYNIYKSLFYKEDDILKYIPFFLKKHYL